MQTPEDPAKIAETPRHFIRPELHPPAEQPSGRRFFIGVASFVLGFIAIYFGGSDSLGLGLAIAGSLLVLASLFAFRGFGSGARAGEDRDIRKLYRSHRPRHP